MSIDLFHEASKAARKGDEALAHQLLQQLVREQPGHDLGWLWLSKVSDDLDEEIRALEMVVKLNPTHEEAAYRLLELKAERKQQQPASADELYREALLAYQNGRAHQARFNLQQIVRADPAHLKAWLGLAQVAQTPAQRIVALETVVAIDPTHAKGTAVLQKLKLNHHDNLAMGRAYEEVGQLNKALAAYQRAARRTSSSADRHIAAKHAREIETRLKTQSQAKTAPKTITVTNVNTTLTRLAFGPVILYFLFLFIHGGLNPLRISWLFYLAVPIVVLGSLLMTGAISTPDHPFWKRIVGPRGITDQGMVMALTAVGLLLLAIPFAMIFVSSINRFIVYLETLASAVP
jgi:hypothetical protein